MAETVRQLTAAIASGDTAAFSRFYRQWFDAAFAEARRASGRDEQYCLDIVQDSMMRVIRSIKPMDSEGDVRRWLAAVVQSCCCDHFRSDNRRARRERTRAGHRQQISLVEIKTQDRLEWLQAQLAELEPEHLRLLSMRFRFGWTLQRIGEALGLKPGAVDGRISRSISALQTKAQEEFHE